MDKIDLTYDNQIKINQIRYLEGLYYSFKLLKYNYQTLYSECKEIQKQSERIMEALSRCWIIIDLVHRIREISQAIPELSQKEPKLKIFLKKTEITGYFRNYIQHLRNGLAAKEVIKSPVYGAISWVDSENEKKSYSAIIGQRFKGTEYSSCEYDSQNRCWVSKVVLNLNGFSYQFDLIYNQTMAFKEFLYNWIKERLKLEINDNAEIPIISILIR
jgi:hypothetical protein